MANDVDQLQRTLIDLTEATGFNKLHSDTHRSHTMWPRKDEDTRQALYGFSDTLDDAAAAILGYTFSEWPHDSRQQILLIYGCLQALFIQQDSVKFLTDYAGIEFKPDGGAIAMIRSVRNSIAGHPHPEMKRGRHRATFLHLGYLSKEEWKFTSDKRRKFRPIEAATEQALQLRPILESAVSRIYEDWGHVFDST
ncbi:MAG: hypothetical protein AAGH87_06925 [Pseudomonadota bacterium]